MKFQCCNKIQQRSYHDFNIKWHKVTAHKNQVSNYTVQLEQANWTTIQKCKIL
jgi:hypothetical protein